MTGSHAFALARETHTKQSWWLIKRACRHARCFLSRKFRFPWKRMVRWPNLLASGVWGGWVNNSQDRKDDQEHRPLVRQEAQTLQAEEKSWVSSRCYPKGRACLRSSKEPGEAGAQAEEEVRK